MDDRNSDDATASQPTDRIKLNVGGTLFETTISTIKSAGPESLLAALSSRSAAISDPVFIDRDPELFSILLFALRSNRLPSTSSRIPKQALIEEALYYGVESRLRSAMSPSNLLGIDAALATTILPASDPFPTAFSAGSDDGTFGSLWIAHGGQISAYDWSLSNSGTVRTHLDEITAIRRAWPEIAAIGSLDSPGLHFYDISSGRHLGSTYWTDPSDLRVYKARVTAIASYQEPNHPIFAAFEAPHRENCIAEVDSATLRVTAHIGRLNGSSTKVASAGKLAFVPEKALVFASAVSSGAFGYSGYMRLWDPRSGAMVWERCEPGSGSSGKRFGDSFADVDVDVDECAIYKVCWKSGDVAVADMRKLGDDPWAYLEDPGGRNPVSGENSVVHCYKKQVFVGKVGGLEVWSTLVDKEEGGERGLCERTFRRNYVDSEQDARRGMIRRMEGGGNRLFLSRVGMEGVEVWESSNLSGSIAVL